MVKAKPVMTSRIDRTDDTNHHHLSGWIRGLTSRFAGAKRL